MNDTQVTQGNPGMESLLCMDIIIELSPVQYILYLSHIVLCVWIHITIMSVPTTY